MTYSISLFFDKFCLRRSLFTTKIFVWHCFAFTKTWILSMDHFLFFVWLRRVINVSIRSHLGIPSFMGTANQNLEVHHAEHVCMSVSLELMFFCTWDGTWCYVLDDMRNQDPESDCIEFQDYYHLVRVNCTSTHKHPQMCSISLSLLFQNFLYDFYRIK